jgi:fibronectin type 3 domain-containing protein
MSLNMRSKAVFLVAAIAIVSAAIFITGCDEPLPTGGAAPATPANVRVSDETFGAVTISWDEVSGAGGYRVYRGNTEDGDFAQVGDDVDSAGLSFTDESLASSTTYWFKVAAFNTDGESAPSIAVNGTTLTPMPVAPENLAMADRTTTSITLEWGAAADATGYRLYRSDASDGVFAQVGDDIGGETSASDTGLMEGTLYWYKISSLIVDVESDMSAAVSARTLYTSITVGVTRSDTVDEGWFDIFQVALDSGQSVTITLSNFSGNCDLFAYANEALNPSIGGATTFNAVETINIAAGTYETIYIQVVNYTATTTYNLLVDQP